MERVVSVAIRLDNGLIHSLPKPNRHFNVLKAMNGDNWKTNKIVVTQGQQGFLLNDGRFVGRVEAAKIALASGQIGKLEHPPNLYSEDLW